MQEALDGIMVSIGKYDYGHPSKATFNTYAYYWIQRNCRKYLRDNASTIRQPLYMQGKKPYVYRFFTIDDPEKDYLNFIKDIN